MLNGKSFLKIPIFVVIQSQVNLGEDQKSVVRVTLDRSDDDAPTTIEVTKPYRKTVVSATHYRKYNNVWICDRASYLDEVQSILTVKQDWVLNKQTPSQPFKVPGPKHILVDDYRLMGPTIVTNGLPFNPTRAEAGSLVHYFWKGSFPSLSELKNLHDLQYPGESTPDSVKTGSSLPFIGGMMCLVGGVWMFKRRGVS